MSRSDENVLPRFGAGMSGALRWLPLGLLLSAALILLWKWDSLPERWVIHWGRHGVPNGWATRAPLPVFLPLVVGAVVCLGLELLATAVIRYPRGHAEIEAAPEASLAMAAVTGEFVRLIAFFVALLFAIIAVGLPLARPQRPGTIIMTALLLHVIPTVIGIVRLKRTARELKSRGLVEGLEGWNGVIYSNPEDPRLMVPKTFGFGYTFNFAQRWAWPLMLLLVGMPLLSIVIAVIVL